MFKYLIVAEALKLFSISSQTKQQYRRVGNIIDQRRRINEGLNSHYVERFKRTLTWCEKYHPFQEGDKLLEVGTGWFHWESIILRLFYNVDITMFDVWDNRYFIALKKFLGDLEKIIDKEISMDAPQSEDVHKFLRIILNAKSFEEIYNLLGLQYVIDPSGTLKQFQNESFNFIFSCEVLQHINREALPELIQDSYRLLKQGGYSIHQIDLCDMLFYYDPSVSAKNYLRYSDKIWHWCFENQVQYFNRIQRPAWLDLFQKVGFELVEEELISAKIGAIKVDKSYQSLSKQDLECGTLIVVLKKR